ncbi:unnamed protein product [Adineta steineri]|uniref:NAD(P)(+)--arginine ADP-ribosyltransferase n=1 Tax=Adineta steineri TaxID=433720 RepID=A0A819Y032_9BILA|nr:unnamed protein product [Adineta steineri]CAF4151316.1 unnamed protein product [Adineta steineri]
MTLLDAVQPRRRIIQDYSLFWLDECIEEANKDYRDILVQLKLITDNVNIFKQRDVCIDYLTDAQKDITSFLVIKDTMSEQIMPLINDIPQLRSIYILNDTKIPPEESIKKWQKIKSVHTNVDDLCQKLQLGIKQHHQDSIAISFITTNEMVSTNNLNQLEPTFMYTQIFKDILLDMEHDKQAITEFITYCRQNNSGSSTNIDQFENDYHTQSAIWWYTSPSFIYSMLNYALRLMEANTIINMGFFIHDLHQKIQQLHQQQINSYHGDPFLVYRGQGLMKSDFAKLQKTKGGLFSFNNFLSTSKEKDVSLLFAESASAELNKVGILFVMSIDPCIKSTPFASIKEESYFNEEDEILFSMHTVFRVSAIKQVDNENQLYQVELQLTSDDDPELRLLTDWIREEADGTGWQRLGKLLLTIGQFNKAEELYNVLLKQTSVENEKQHYYSQLGFAHLNKGDYEKAISYYNQALEIREKIFPSNHPNLATSYSNIGSVYDNMGEYSRAVSYHEKAVEICEKTLPSNHLHLAQSYNNIGNIYTKMGEYSKALSSLEKALEICRKTLPSNHPDMASSYNNIGSVYIKIGEHSKALSFYGKALEIDQKTLPSNHPDLANSYNNIGLVYDNMGEYLKGLSFYKNALEIREKSLSSNHPALATSYNNIGLVYDSMGEYSKAVSCHEKALILREKILSSNHPLLATSYNNIGNVYTKMGEYLKALSSHEKALDIYQKALPSNHPDLANSYNSIGSVYDNMGEYPKALTSFGKALEIYQRTLPSNHPDMAISYNNIGSVHTKMGENLKALSFFENVLEIQQKTLPSNHPTLAISYNNIGYVYDIMGEYSKALSTHEKALEIREKTVPSNHPDLATSYNNVGSVYNTMGEYSRALSYYEGALDIFQHALPPTHPHIKKVKESIENVKKKL